MVTRNAYGTLVLNTARLLFLDIDAPAPTVRQRLGRLFGRADSAGAVSSALRDRLRAAGATFRVYATASGLRVMAVDREFDPAGADTQALMQATSTDPAFARLCRVQGSFRARLTPKPWRCRVAPPPSSHPHPAGGARERFDDWLREYERASSRYATCRYLETIGTGGPRGAAGRLVELHDRTTRCNEALPLA